MSPDFLYWEHVSANVFLSPPSWLLSNWEIMDDNNTCFAGTLRDKQLTKAKEGFACVCFFNCVISNGMQDRPISRQAALQLKYIPRLK